MARSGQQYDGDLYLFLRKQHLKDLVNLRAALKEIRSDSGIRPGLVKLHRRLQKSLADLRRIGRK